MPYLFGNQQYNARRKYNGWYKTVVMLPVTMPKGVHANGEGDKDHPVFQGNILNDVDAKYGQAGKQQW